MIEVRSGTQYCGKDAAVFMQSLFDEFRDNYPGTYLYLRGDSGFAMPDLFDACEDNHCKYAIRLKENATLHKLVADLDAILYDRTKDNIIDYAEVFGEIDYQAGSWRQERRVVVKIEKPYGQLVPSSCASSVHEKDAGGYDPVTSDKVRRTHCP